MHRLRKSNQAIKDYKTGMRFQWYAKKMAKIMRVLKVNPLENTPGHRLEKLVGRLKDTYSRQINLHNRIVYSIHPNTDGARDEHGNLYKGVVIIHSAWGHDYDSIVLPS